MPACIPAGRAHRLGIAYFALQGACVTAWWALLFGWPGLVALFHPASFAREQLVAFLPADLFLVAGGSFAIAVQLARGRSSATPLLWLTSGAMGYATLYCATVFLMTGEAGLGALLMLPGAIATTCFAARLWREP